MNIIWGIVIAQLLLLAVALVLIFASRLTPNTAVKRHRTYRALGVAILCTSTVLVLPLLWLASLVIGLGDYLLVFGVPVGTLGLSVLVIHRAGGVVSASQ
jgi:hypothetical protein